MVLKLKVVWSKDDQLIFSQKLKALTRIAFYVDQKKKMRINMYAYINSQFGYCPLVWMTHSKTMIKIINKIHERALTQPAITYSKLTTETLEQVMKYVQS